MADWSSNRVLPKPFHGLIELAKRKGWRDLRHTERDGVYLSERTVFRDTATGCIAWRLTCDPSVNETDYYDIPGWNSNGSLIGFLRGGTKVSSERWLMDANGNNLRPLPTSDGKAISTGFWSLHYPDRFYHALVDGGRTQIVSTNPLTGERDIIVSADRYLGQMLPPHPSEKEFLFGIRTGKPRPGKASEPSAAYVIALDGTIKEIGFEKRWHRLRFTKSVDSRIFFNFDYPRTQWTILADGTDRKFIPQSGHHPDWQPDGSELTFYDGGAIWGVRYDGQEQRCLIDLGTGGHGGPCLDGEWFVSDTNHKGNYPGSILYFRTDGSGICHTVFKHLSSFYEHDVQWHPHHHSSHPHPNSSPDGTKSIFNSDFIQQYSDIYIVINRFPDPPKNLKSRIQGKNVILTWNKPNRGKETKGYCVYRSDESGINYERVEGNLRKETEWCGPGGKNSGYYVVTAVEWSGLESRPSNEVFGFGNGNSKGNVRLFLEVEVGDHILPVRECLDQRTSSNGYFVACQGGNPGGSLTLECEVPKENKYFLWARVKGTGAWLIELDGKLWGASVCLGEKWTWQRVDVSLEITCGTKKLTFVPNTGEECIDRVLLTDDIKLVPKGMMGLDAIPPDPPKNVIVTVLSPNALKLSWSKVEVLDFDHYNIYCGQRENFVCEQASLIGSPSATEFVDWGLDLNTSYWYRVTAVDCTGNESKPTDVAFGTTSLFEPIRIVLKAEDAVLEKLDLFEDELARSKVLQFDGKEKGASGVWIFDMDQNGDYAIWGYSMHRKDEPSIFELSIDESPGIEWHVWGKWDIWNWSPAGPMVAGSPRIFALKAGKHTFRICPKTQPARMSKIIITNDPTWWPVEMRSNNLNLDCLH